MNHKRISALILALLLLAACGGKKAGAGEAEKKLADTEKQLQDAKTQPGAEQKIAELQKQLDDAKKQLAEAKGETAAPPAEPPPPPKPVEYVIAAGTMISVRTTTALSTETAATGAPFSASLTAPLTVDGVVLAPAGVGVSGVVVLSDPGGRVKGRASIAVALKSIRGKYGPITVQTNSHQAIAPSTVKKDVKRGAIMTGAGAAIGAIAGGGKGAAIGAGVGGAAGVGTAMATKGAPAQIPAETALTFRTKAPVTITVQP